MNLRDVLLRFARDLELVMPPGRGGGFLLAVSGGADSTALLRLFQLVRDEPSVLRENSAARNFREIVVGHVHHSSRPGEADADATFVKELAASHDMECLLQTLDVPELARRRGQSFELTARQERYRVLGGWARQRGLDFVVTAHHGDDQQETVLLRIARGAGIRGLGGIPPRRRLGPAGDASAPLVIRPLLEWRRAELLRLLREIEQPFREDSTNADPTIPRNAVRHQVLPLLRETVHPGTGASLQRLSAFARQLTGDLELIAAEKWKVVRLESRETADSVVLSLEAMRDLPRTLRGLLVSRALRVLARRLDEDEPRLSSWQEREIERRLFAPASEEDRVLVRPQWSVAVGGDVLKVERRPPETAAAPPPPPPTSLEIPGEALWGDWRIRVDVLDDRPELAAESRWCEVFALDAVGGPLSVRARRSGDVFEPLGTHGRKKLKDFLRECGMAVAARDRHPLVAADGRLLWVVGERLAHPFRVTEATRSWGRLTAERASKTS